MQAIILVLVMSLVCAQPVGQKPETRANAEDRESNLQRYRISENEFRQNSKFYLGVMVEYSGNGAEVVEVKGGSPAQIAGIKVGDIIMDIDGSPVGVIRDRTYEIWRRYSFAQNNEIVIGIAFPKQDAQGFTSMRYYYQKVKLTPLGQTQEVKGINN